MKGVVRPDGSVTAGNASGVNDGACALLLASEAAAQRHGLTPRARVLGMATAGVAPRIMGIGPAPATRKAAGANRPDAGTDGRDRAQRGLCRAGRWPCCASWAWPTTTRASTRTAAPSRSATRWAPAARGW
jgi:hypothetical protein